MVPHRTILKLLLTRQFLALRSPGGSLAKTDSLRDNRFGVPKRSVQTIACRSLSYEVFRNPKLCGIDETHSNVDLSDLHLKVDTSNQLSFNVTWLRDSCHCKECTHQHSRQRLITAKDFRRSMFSVREIQLVDSVPSDILILLPPSTCWHQKKYIKVNWGDGHESYYSLDWLVYIHHLHSSSCFKSEATNSKFQFPHDDFYSAHPNTASSTPWDVSKINSNLRPINYHDLVQGFSHSEEPTFINQNKITDMNKSRFAAILSLSSQLVTNGLTKIVNVPTERNHVLRIVRSLAYERPTGYGTVFDVVVEPSEEINLAYSSVEFDIHSDLTYREISPGVQLLHCIRNSVDGGLSYFSDALNAALTLRETQPALFQVLVQFPVTFVVRDPYRDVKFRKHIPVISLDYNGGIGDIYYSPFMLPPIGFIEDVKLFYLAFDKFTQILQSEENKLISKMEPGDLFIFHNRRVLHGRSAYNPKTSSRFLQGCYMDWDEILCLYEKFKLQEDIPCDRH